MSLSGAHDVPGMALVIGYGNPLRSDDGVGWRVTQRLAADLAEDVDIMSTHQLTPELAEPISRARLVVFVDASIGGEPGSVAWQIVAPAAHETATLSHDVDPASLLELAHLVYDASPTAIVVSVAGADFGYGVGLSGAVLVAIPAAVRRVRALIAAGVDGLGQIVNGSVDGLEGASHA